MRSIIYLGIVSFLLFGCAIHSPMSEMIMFHEKEDRYGRKYDSRYSHSVASVTTNLYSSKVINEYAEVNYPTGEDTQYDYASAATIMTSAIFMADGTNNFAVSLAIGNNFGLDATAKLFGRTYLTGALSIGPRSQGLIVLQQRLKDGNPFGLSLGLIYQRNYQYVPIDGVSCGFCFPSEEFYTNSIGIRSVGLMAPPQGYGDSKFFLYMTGSINYDITMETFYPKIGFALGLY